MLAVVLSAVCGFCALAARLPAQGCIAARFMSRWKAILVTIGRDIGTSEAEAEVVDGERGVTTAPYG